MKTKITTLSIISLIAVTIAYKYVNSEIHYKWSSNRISVYDFSYKALGESYGRTLGSVYSIVEDQSIETTLRGRLEVYVREEVRDLKLLSFKLTPVDSQYLLTKDNKKSGVPFSQMEFFVYWNEKEGFSDIFFSKYLIPDHEHILRDIISMLQIKIDNRKTKSWNVIQETIAGKESVDFSYSPFNFSDISIRPLLKEFVEFSENRETSGEVQFSILSDGVLKLIDGNKSEVFHFDENLIAKSNRKIRIEYLGEKDVDTGLSNKSITRSRDYKRARLDGSKAKLRLKRKSDIEIVSDRSYEQIIEPLLNMDNMEVGDQANLFQTLSAYLRLFPESLDDIAKLLETYTQKDPQFDIISTALGAVGTPRVQEVMRELILKFDDAEKTQVMLNLAFVDGPTAESNELFWDLYESVDDYGLKSKSLYSVGIQLSKLNEESEIYYTSVDKIKTIYSNSNNLEDKNLILKAISNSGSNEFNEIIFNEVKSESGTKLNAIAALKNVRSDKSKEILIELAESSEKDSKYAAVRSLSEYGLDDEIINTYESMLYEESNRRVTAQVLKNMDVPIKNPELLSVLNDYAKVCPSVELCQLVKRAIN